MTARAKKLFEARKRCFLTRHWKMAEAAWKKTPSEGETIAANLAEHSLVVCARWNNIYTKKTVEVDIARGLMHTYERMKKEKGGKACPNFLRA